MQCLMSSTLSHETQKLGLKDNIGRLKSFIDIITKYVKFNELKPNLCKLVILSSFMVALQVWTHRSYVSL